MCTQVQHRFLINFQGFIVCCVDLRVHLNKFADLLYKAHLFLNRLEIVSGEIADGDKDVHENTHQHFGVDQVQQAPQHSLSNVHVVLQESYCMGRVDDVGQQRRSKVLTEHVDFLALVFFEQVDDSEDETLLDHNWNHSILDRTLLQNRDAEALSHRRVLGLFQHFDYLFDDVHVSVVGDVLDAFESGADH